jgi:DsbC/DsbD-like thiol-disulfide interchange protein
MFQRISYSAILSVLVVFLFACSHSSTPSNASPAAQVPTTSVKFVTASAGDVQIPAGGSADVFVKLTIQSGYHVNANPATYSYLRPTELVVQTGDGVSVGFIIYPDPVSKKFSFAEQPLKVYEGEVAIKVMLKASPSAVRGARALPAKLSVQACDDKVCYAPGTLELSIPATIK